jgi:hypothetical protein
MADLEARLVAFRKKFKESIDRIVLEPAARDPPTTFEGVQFVFEWSYNSTSEVGMGSCSHGQLNTESPHAPQLRVWALKQKTPMCDVQLPWP